MYQLAPRPHPGGSSASGPPAEPGYLVGGLTGQVGSAHEGHPGCLLRTGVAWNVRRVLAKTPSRRHFESKRTSKTGSTSKIGSRNGFVRFGKFCIVRSLSPYGVLNSGHKLTVTYYGEITIEPILNPEFDVDHDFEVKNGCFQSLFPRFRVISVYSTGRASHSDHFSGQVSMATIQRSRRHLSTRV